MDGSSPPNSRRTFQPTRLTPLRAVLVLILLVSLFWLNRDGTAPQPEPERPAAENTLPGPDLRQPSQDLSTLEVTDDEPARQTGVNSATGAVVQEPVARQGRRPSVEKPSARDSAATKIDGVTVRDLDGKIVFRGTVDVQPTLDRIDAGRRLEFRNDGSVFQNREGRLPRKPSGYYKEYVHLTPKLSGPGPQRVVVGQQGEAYYTPDHYQTFEKVR